MEAGMKMVRWINVKNNYLAAAFITIIFLTLTVSGCSQPEGQLEIFMPETGEPAEILSTHAGHFEKRIDKVTEGVYVAIGYALANVIIIETEEGNIIIDTTEGIEAAQEIKNDFAKISEAPTRAIIYTHAHPDHISVHRFLPKILLIALTYTLMPTIMTSSENSCCLKIS